MSADTYSQIIFTTIIPAVITIILKCEYQRNVI